MPFILECKFHSNDVNPSNDFMGDALSRSANFRAFASTAKEIRFVCFYQVDVITEFISFIERSFSKVEFSSEREGWGRQMLKNANSVPDVPRILIIRLKRSYICMYQCVLLLRLMFLLLSAICLPFLMCL